MHMKELRKEDFDRQLVLPGLKIANTQIQTFVTLLKPLLYVHLRVDRVQPCS